MDPMPRTKSVGDSADILVTLGSYTPTHEGPFGDDASREGGLEVAASSLLSLSPSKEAKGKGKGRIKFNFYDTPMATLCYPVLSL